MHGCENIKARPETYKTLIPTNHNASVGTLSKRVPMRSSIDVTPQFSTIWLVEATLWLSTDALFKTYIQV